MQLPCNSAQLAWRPAAPGMLDEILGILKSKDNIGARCCGCRISWPRTGKLSMYGRGLNPALAQAVTIQETAKSLICSELGTRYRALSADATTAYGLSPALVIHDELGQVRGPRSPLYEALETATGAEEGPLLLIHSAPQPTDATLLT